MAKSIKDRLLTLGSAAVVGLGAIPLSNIAVAADEVTFDGATIHIPSEGTHYLNLTVADNIATLGQTAELTYENINFHEGDSAYGGGQVLYINLDAAGYEEFNLPTVHPESSREGEQSVFAGSNILWNIYDSSSEDKMYHGKVTKCGGGGFVGCILAPEADFECDVPVDGTIIAENIRYNNEIHKASFLAPQPKEQEKEKVDVTKTWGQLMMGMTQPNSVTVNLYRSRNGNLDPKYCEENAVNYTGTQTTAPAGPAGPGAGPGTGTQSEQKVGQDGLPYTQGTYKDSVWYSGGPLGVAGDFEVFAFDTITHNQHLNGNLACKKLVMVSSLPVGPNTGSQNLISIVTDTLEITNKTPTMPCDMIDYKMNHFVIPENYNVAAWGWINENGESRQGNTMAYPYKGDHYMLDVFAGDLGPYDSHGDFAIAMNMSNKELYLLHADKGYLDLDALQLEYDALCKKIATENYDPTKQENEDLNAVEFVGQRTLNEASGWKASFEDLPKTDCNGNPWYYYVKEDTSKLQRFTDSYEGNPVSNGDGTVNITNKVFDIKTTTVEFSKQDLIGGELAGATLKLTGKKTNGEEISLESTMFGGSRSVLELGTGAEAISDRGKEISWKSGTTPTKVKYMPDGIYTLEETAAPDGYNITTKVTFEIRDQKIVKIGETEVTSEKNTIIMDDAPLKDVVISKQTLGGT
ncbi:MAG: Cna B-type domain-containing protein, partial [Oscillospiraceae bacterium]|nr:Cna B-type domain-containing protein [Oscillospiraceae bacterium]